MRVLISGAGGLVGRELSRELREGGHEVVALSRLQSGGGWRAGHGLNCVVWSPESQEAHIPDFEGFDAVVHLAGEPILGRWNEGKKKRIRDSRVTGTRYLGKILSQVERKPQVLLSASAIGFYGDTGDQMVDEQTVVPKMTGDFLAETCAEWEDAAREVSSAGIRTVQARIGIVLSKRGGALGTMLLPFQLGLGGPVGSGNQWMSCISNRDIARAMAFLVGNSSCEGAYNLVGPEPVTNREFSRLLGRALHRPAFLPVPAFAVRLLFGKECADATVLRSTRVVPRRLQEAGFTFEHPLCEGQLEWALTAA